jgi:hypothetical protein
MSLVEVIRRLLSGEVAHRRLAAYIAREARHGRTLADVLEDPFVVNRTRRVDRRRLLEDADLMAQWHAALILGILERWEAVGPRRPGAPHLTGGGVPSTVAASAGSHPQASQR